MEERSKSHNKKKKIIEKYNSSSHFYDKRYALIQKDKFEIVLNNYRAEERLILDLGCGTGLFFEYINKSILNNEKIKLNYVGLDISWNMLLEFKSKISNSVYRICHPNLILSDIEYLPFRENIFLTVFALTSFQNLPNIKNGIIESFRVGKNNAEYKFSILKKKLDTKSLLKIIKTKLRELSITNNENLEDIVIQGVLSKE
ncbi:MAG: class I SAM-dependent methyltransferase [Promethearchaeota archaeon]